MKKYLYDFLLMLQLLTRVPVNKALPCENENFRNGANFFWLIGLLLGIFQYLLFTGTAKLVPTAFAVIAIIVFEILVTGALHMDGFGDTCDGFFAFKGKDKIIEIMKDSRIGTFGCIGIVLNLLIKYEAYLFLLTKKDPIALLIIPVISRFSMILLSYIGKPAKEKGSGNLFINNVTLKEAVVNALFAIAIGLALGLVFETAALFIAAVIITVLFNLFCNSKINGITGDSLGANNELVMLLSLIILSSF
ncbi:adenosylcobinamide-GDP ribazoletransferase [Clostridium swellfunianum]|uniref:adenosylcobinamide-GDP ribazoletransferase n=1 Tax=Clostridium swellfunianum TaxID=1367462 RepID=UPI00202F4BFE|nr:adenosylcobinamide-GDP ribazoletransferase [Clostridium swellfunianum]MCM0649951.1 adenosylcobinamide-GDP ribazoletransferase [Clostridium swellfunianum]